MFHLNCYGIFSKTLIPRCNKNHWSQHRFFDVNSRRREMITVFATRHFSPFYMVLGIENNIQSPQNFSVQVLTSKVMFLCKSSKADSAYILRCLKVP